MDEKGRALRFVNSPRGKYIISQALCIASKELSKVKAPHTEYSNIRDMEFLIATLFPLYRIQEQVTEQVIEDMKSKK
jgi:hypothetical protein